MKGTKVDTFQAEVIGVLRNTSPGGDIGARRLAGLDLEKTGIIARHVRKPGLHRRQIARRLLTAGPSCKEPIAGITPFCQTHSFVESDELAATSPNRASRAASASGIRCRSPRRRQDPLRQRHRVRNTPTTTAARTEDGRGPTPPLTPLAATGSDAHSPSCCAAARAVLACASVMVERPRPRRRSRPATWPWNRGTAPHHDDHRRLRSVRHRHGDAHRGGSRLRLGASVHRGRRLPFPLMPAIFTRSDRGKRSASKWARRCGRWVSSTPTSVPVSPAGWAANPTCRPFARRSASDDSSPARSTSRCCRRDLCWRRSCSPRLTNSVDMERDLREEMTAELYARIEIEGSRRSSSRTCFPASPAAASAALYNELAAAITC